MVWKEIPGTFGGTKVIFGVGTVHEWAQVACFTRSLLIILIPKSSLGRRRIETLTDLRNAMPVLSRFLFGFFEGALTSLLSQYSIANV